MNQIEVESSDHAGTFAMYVAMPPKAEPAPALIIATHIMGTTQDMLDIAESYAAEGYIVAVPDIFWRVSPGPGDRTTEEGRSAAFARGSKVNVDLAVEDIGTTMETLRAMPECNGKFGAVGFCFGGMYAFLASTRLGMTEIAAFHGVKIHNYLTEAPSIAGGLSLHYGDADKVIPMEQVQAVEAALGTLAEAEVCVYPGAQHGFTSIGQPAYDANAATTSHEKAFAKFARLQSGASGR